MLRFRNTYKNCKMMIFYAGLGIISLIIASALILLAFRPEFKFISIIGIIIFVILFILSFFMLVLKNNNYKLKYFFKLGSFYKEFKSFKKNYKGNKKTIKNIKNQQKDYFLQFGKCCFTTQLYLPPKNKWNIWIEDCDAFTYQNSGYMEKLSFLTYILYNACVGGGGFEEFFTRLSYEPFSKEEILEIINKSDFYCKDLKDLLCKKINEFDLNEQEKLFEKYENSDNKILFSFEIELFNYANWLAYNRFLLSSCAGVYVHANINFNIYKIFLSKDYQNVLYIYSTENNLIKVNHIIWNEIDEMWNLSNLCNSSVFENVDLAYNDIYNSIKDYIEIEI